MNGAASTAATSGQPADHLGVALQRRLTAIAHVALDMDGTSFQPTADDPDDEPDAVVVGFDMTLDYARVCRAAWWISRGKPFGRMLAQAHTISVP